MVAAILKRLASILITALLVAILSFTVIYFSPGNPAEVLLTQGHMISGFDANIVEMYAERLGLDQSLPVQLRNWLGGVIRGDLGFSFRTGVPVWEEFTARFGLTFSLMLFGTAVMMATGVTLGIISALYHNRIVDRIISILVILNTSIPNFWMALLFLWIFALTLQWLPSFGFHGFASLILPGTVLGIGRSSSIIMLTKSCLIEEMNSLYSTTARAKGLSEPTVLARHILKNIALPIITMCGMQMNGMLGGSVIVESIFGLPGIGNFLLNSIQMKDMPAIAGFVFLICIIIILINLLVDILYFLIDPKVRLAMYAKEI